MISWQILIEVSVTMILLYLVYMCIRNRISHLAKRFALLTIPVFAVLTVVGKSFLMADVSIVNVPIVEMDPVVVGGEATSDASNLDWRIFYLIGIIGMLSFLIYKVVRLMLFFRKAIPLMVEPAVKVLVSDNKDSFSFFNRIHLSAELNEDERQVVLEHELLHYQKSHSLDLILMEIYHSLFWFNPLMILMKKELIQIHEYEVDEKMYEKYDKVYLSHLVSYALGTSVAHLLLTSQFYRKMTLAQRIEKMKTNKRSSKLAFMALPALAICLALISWTNTPDTIPATSDYRPEKVKNYGDDLDKQPQFKGGQEAMIEFITENVKYPEEAKKKDLQGTVFVWFMVQTNGELTDIKVVKGDHELLNDEAMRVVKLMPAWEPGEKKGKAVKTQMTLPITFKL